MTTYKIDPMHSEIKFKVKHLMISHVTGAFKSFDATMESEKEDFSDAKISFEADVNSIDTNQDQRDAHLKSDDFFNAEKYPKIKFVSKGLKKVSGDEFKLTGDLTIRDITKELTMDVDFGGTTLDFYGQQKAGFELTGKISRSDFNLKWNAVTEAGGVVVSDEIKLQLEAQMVKQ